MTKFSCIFLLALLGCSSTKPGCYIKTANWAFWGSVEYMTLNSCLDGAKDFEKNSPEVQVRYIQRKSNEEN